MKTDHISNFSNLRKTSDGTLDLHLSHSEFLCLKDEFRTSIVKMVPGLGTAIDKLLERISTKNWALEWGMVRWIGEAFALDEDIIKKLILANVYMLAFVRIVDDLVDDDFQDSGQPLNWFGSEDSTPKVDNIISVKESPEFGQSRSDRGQLILLVTLLHQLWLQTHQGLLASGNIASSADSERIRESTFLYWQSAELSLQQFITATSDQCRRAEAELAPFTEDEIVKTGHRFALLKTSCVVTCLLAGRQQEIDPLTTLVNHILECAVLIDDVFDWIDDLEAHRYNVFIAFCSTLAQVSDNQFENQQRVLNELYLGKVIYRYFDLILERHHKAKKLSESLNIPKLDAFVDCLHDDITSYCEMLHEGAMSQLKVAYENYKTSTKRGETHGQG